MLDVANIKAGETVVVTGAAGAVGTVVRAPFLPFLLPLIFTCTDIILGSFLQACQIAKLKGCRVIAIAGGQEKCDFLVKELGVDAALDYKSPTFAKDFKSTVGYLDVCFENVGGAILDLVLTRLKKGARIALCGSISAYNDPNPKGLQMYLNLISQRAKLEGPFAIPFRGLSFHAKSNLSQTHIRLPPPLMGTTGFIVFDYAERYPEAESDLSQWIQQGKLKVRETRLDGLDKCVDGLCGLFRGENTGKLVVRVGRDEAKL